MYGAHECQHCVGLDITRFHQAITKRIFAQRVQQDLISRMESSVKDTPTYFINGIKHTGSRELDSLLAAIEETEQI